MLHVFNPFTRKHSLHSDELWPLSSGLSGLNPEKPPEPRKRFQRTKNRMSVSNMAGGPQALTNTNPPETEHVKTEPVKTENVNTEHVKIDRLTGETFRVRGSKRCFLNGIF